MQKISFRNVLAQCGVGMVVIVFASVGSILIREARSFKDPGGGPGASGALAQDVGVIGNPADGIAGAPSLFQGQKAIKDAIGVGGGKVYQSVWTTIGYNGAQVGGLSGADEKCQAEFGSDFHFARSFEEWASSAPGNSYRSNYIWVHNSTLNCNLWTDATGINNSTSIRIVNSVWESSVSPFCSSAYYLSCTNK